ncbi:acyltransferase [Arenimonas oryziterrae]|nr:acyltransferase [Arenimonas oryziterrae]
MSGRHWASVGESTFVAGIWFLYGVYRWFGRTPFRLCLYPVVFYYWLTRPMARRASREYLERLQASHQVFERAPGLRHSFRHFICFAETLLDKALAMSGRYRRERLEFHGHEAVLAAIGRGQGGVMITAHMGCLELLQTAAVHREGLRVTILVHTAHAQRFNRLLHRLNPDSRVSLMQVTDFSAVTVMMLADRVAAGEFIAIAGDRVPVQGDRVVQVPFLGHSAPLPIGPYLLASLLQCPAYLIGCLHHGEGYQVEVSLLAEQVRLPRGTREQALTAYAGEFARWMEGRLRLSPYDWFNFFPFWDQTTHAHAPR